MLLDKNILFLFGAYRFGRKSGVAGGIIIPKYNVSGAKRRARREDALRDSVAYFAESTRVLAAKYAGAFRRARRGVGQERAFFCALRQGGNTGGMKEDDRWMAANL